jgi:glycosyltransferase involved in cell wall biosynthesis
VRIAFLAWRDLAHPQAGGSEVLVDRLASSLSDRGHDVTLVCGGPVGARPYRVIDAGGRFTQYLRAPAAALRHCRHADLVVDVANGMSYLSPLWRRKPSVCFVNHVHTEQWEQWFGPVLAGVGRTLERRVMPWLYRRRLFVAVSPSTAEGLTSIGVHPEQIRIVPNGVEPPTVKAPKAEEPLFVAVGRLVPHKRFDLLLPLWDRVRDYTGGRLVIIGDGPEEARLRELAGPGVELLGYVPEEEKQRLLAEAWLLVHPSQFEGWGLVVTEAAAAGTPTLAFDVPGVRDSVVHGETGVLVRTPVEMAAEWVALTADARRRATLGTQARWRAARFTAGTTVERFLEVADEAVARHRAPRVPARARAVPLLAPPPPTEATPEVSIIVPAYNEATRLPEALPQLVEAARALDSELIVVDDGSTDDTGEVASELLGGSELLDGTGRHLVLRHDGNHGKGAAVRTGVAQARGQKIVFMDADLAADLSHLPELLEALERSHLAIGSRAAPGAVTTGATRGRAYMGWAFNHWARAVTGAPLDDFQCGFKAFRAPAAKLLFDLCHVDGYAFDVEILALAHRFGYGMVEIPVRWHAVPGGHVRPARDAPTMAVSVVRSRLRWTHRRSLAAIEAADPSGRNPERIAAELAPRLDRPAPIIPWRDGALALLPFVDHAAAARVAVHLQEELPELSVRSAQLPARQLLAPSGRPIRSAIVAA